MTSTIIPSSIQTTTENMKSSLFSFAVCALLATVFNVRQANATTAAELQSICDGRKQWCIRAEANGDDHPAPSLSSDNAVCYNYNFGRMCAYTDNANAIMTCTRTGKQMLAHFRGGSASLEGNTQDFTFLWGLNGVPTIKAPSSKINLYVACNP